MKVGVFYTPNPRIEHKWILDAMYKGVSKYEDCFLANEYKYQECDVSVNWGIYKKHVPKTIIRKRIQNHQRELNKKCVVLEKGYIHRNRYYSVGYNSQNGWADFNNKNMPRDRWAQLNTKIKDYRKNGDHIVLCGQVPWDSAVQHVDYKKWCADIVQKIKQHSDRKIIFRPHPLAKGAIPKLEGATFSDKKTIQEDLINCWAVVAFNSNSSVEALLEGIPSFVCDNGSMAFDVSNKDFSLLENPKLYDLTQWSHNLAYTQWTIGEITNGEAWRHLKQ